MEVGFVGIEEVIDVHCVAFFFPILFTGFTAFWGGMTCAVLAKWLTRSSHSDSGILYGEYLLLGNALD